MYVYFNNTIKTFITNHEGEYLTSSNPLSVQDLERSMQYTMYANHEIEPIHESQTPIELRKHLAEM